jgi:rSAM/selenodomain-associated transferase 2
MDDHTLTAVRTRDTPADAASRMQVSVIIPALNEQPLIAAAIRSAWLAGANEVIVADGGSSDETVRVAEDSGAVAITASRGRAVQCNAGAAVATGNVLLFVHADCELDPDSIRVLKERLFHQSQIVAGGFRQRIDNQQLVFRLLQWGNALRIRVLNWVYGDQALFIRSRIFHELGGFPSVALMEDLLLSRRMAREGRIVLLDPPVRVSSRRWQQRGVLRQTFRNWLMIALLFCRVSPDRLAQFYPHVR